MPRGIRERNESEHAAHHEKRVVDVPRRRCRRPSLDRGTFARGSSVEWGPAPPGRPIHACSPMKLLSRYLLSAVALSVSVACGSGSPGGATRPVIEFTTVPEAGSGGAERMAR